MSDQKSFSKDFGERRPPRGRAETRALPGGAKCVRQHNMTRPHHRATPDRRVGAATVVLRGLWVNVFHQGSKR